MKYIKIFEEFNSGDIKIAHFFIDDYQGDPYPSDLTERDRVYFQFEKFIKNNYPDNSLFSGIGPNVWSENRMKGNIFILFEGEHFSKKYQDFVPRLGLASVTVDGKVKMIYWEDNAPWDDLYNTLFDKNIMDQKFKEYAKKDPETINQLVNYVNPSWFRFEWKDSRYEK